MLTAGALVAAVGTMMFATVQQPAIGWMLDRFWSGDTMQGVRIYGISAYQAGFSLMMA